MRGNGVLHVDIQVLARRAHACRWKMALISFATYELVCGEGVKIKQKHGQSEGGEEAHGSGVKVGNPAGLQQNIKSTIEQGTRKLNPGIMASTIRLDQALSLREHDVLLVGQAPRHAPTACRSRLFSPHLESH